MKLLLKIFLSIFLCVILISLSACNDNAGKDNFKTKQDSLAFAKTVFKAYPNEKNLPLVVTFAERSSEKMLSEPVAWDTIDKYKTQYDISPLLQKPGGGAYYKGFILNTASFTTFKNNTNCSQLYFRLGKNDNGEYTIMVLPMDAKRNLLQSTPVTGVGQNLNQDHLDPCPSECPNGTWQ